jgi:hypothetical protein
LGKSGEIDRETMVLNTPRAVPVGFGMWCFCWDFEAKVPGSMSIIAQEPGDRINRY